MPRRRSAAFTGLLRSPRYSWLLLNVPVTNPIREYSGSTCVDFGRPSHQEHKLLYREKKTHV
ncbi:hypothetical protein J6590_107249 [Homalodisca vitripennis]|nr:hypothetical protein J6590_107249 [Homalodisca vitripennis]